MTLSPTPEQVATQVAAIRKQRPGGRIVGIYSPGGWAGGDEIAVNGERVPVAFCRSRLEISERLAALGDADGLVLLTPLTDQSLSLDVLARIAGRRLVHIDRWEMVREAFSATQIDPRLPMQGWLADALLGAMPEAGFPPVPSGWLDADTVWQALLGHYMGLVTGRPDAGDLIRWSVDAEGVSRYALLTEPLRAGIRDHVVESVGALGEILTTTIEQGQGASLLPIGLVCEVLFVASRRQSATLSQAIARLEPLMGGRTLTPDQGQVWYEAAKTVLDTLSPSEKQIWIERSEGLLADLKAHRFARLSTVFSSGFQQRLEAFGEAVVRYLDDKAEVKDIEEAFGEVLRHKECENNPERMDRLEMVLKLVRKLGSTSHDTAPTVGAAVESHLADGVFVDWARRYLLGGDPIEKLATAFARLYRHIRDLRAPQNQVFAQRLRDWNKLPKPENGFLPIEQFLDKVVAVVAAKQPVLVVVIDGMDGGVFEELSEDLRHWGWVRWAAPSGEGSGGLLGVLPTVTEFSRTALLTGQVKPGSSATEKSGFAGHNALRKVSRPTKPPLLFHKGDLTDTAAQGLSSMVRESINSTDQKVVGVVINAVDDHLAKSEQLRLKWPVDSFRVLDALLYEANVSGRAVVLTSDHGHVLEENGMRLNGESEERWRAYGEPVSDQELVFKGPRIRAATGADQVVLLWGEETRYCQKKNGYHGGATPQEAVVPLGVFLSIGQELDGWQPLAEYVPEWWLVSGPAEVKKTQPAKKGSKKAAKPSKGQASLFEPLEQEVEQPVSSWISQLVDSEVFAAQQRLASRLAPPTTTVQEVLATLEARHSRVPKRILAQTIQVPEFRLRGILVGLQRLLNVDGYQVLSVEEETETVLLDIDLLKKQFQLGD
jgi:hypothetical protein